MRRPTRFATVLVFIALGGLLYWHLSSRVKETTIVFVLADLEVPEAGGPLRYEDVERLDVRVVDPEGRPLATITHRRPGAVSNPSDVRLPPGTYAVDVTITLRQRRGGTRAVRRTLMQSLEGGRVEIRL